MNYDLILTAFHAMLGMYLISKSNLAFKLLLIDVAFVCFISALQNFLK